MKKLVIWSSVCLVVFCCIAIVSDKASPAMMQGERIEYIGEPETYTELLYRLQHSHELIPVPGNPLEADESGTWLPLLILAWVYTLGVGLIYSNSKKHNRNAVRWMTVAIIFTPILAWAAYGLTWRKPSSVS